MLNTVTVFKLQLEQGSSPIPEVDWNDFQGHVENYAVWLYAQRHGEPFPLTNMESRFQLPKQS